MFIFAYLANLTSTKLLVFATDKKSTESILNISKTRTTSVFPIHCSASTCSNLRMDGASVHLPPPVDDLEIEGFGAIRK